MNSRELVLAALNHKETDITPLDIGGHRSSAISALAYARLKRYLGIDTGNVYVYDMIQQLAIIESSIMAFLKSDAIEMGRAFCTDDNEWKDWVLPDGTPCKIPNYVNVEKRGEDWVLLANDGQELAVQRKGCLYFEQTHFPLADVDFDNTDFSEVETALDHVVWCAVPHPGAHLPLTVPNLKMMSTLVSKLRNETDKAIIGLFGGNLFEIPQYLIGTEKYLMYMALYPDAIHRLSEKLTDIHIGNLKKWLGAVGNNIDVVLFGDDLGSNSGPLISPEMYREYYKPYHHKMWKLVKEMTNAKIQIHSCGGIEPFLEDMIDAGLEAINPVQISSAGMDVKVLKEKYGDRMCFWGGGCDTQSVLHTKSPLDVKAHVKQQVDILKRGGGFVFQQVHNILANVPPENILAMVDQVKGN
jgi:uroporphyrinogen decarboxylase